MSASDERGVHELAGAYVLGALDADGRREFEAHLATCAACTAEVRTLRPVAVGLAQAVPQHDPPADLRARVLAMATGRGGAGVVQFAVRERPAPALAWLAAAAALVAAVGLGVYTVQLRDRIASLETRLADATLRATAGEREVADARQELGEAQSTMAVLTAPDLARVDLAGQPTVAAEARGRAFLSPSRGLVFTATNLPALPADRIYQLWYLPPQGAPVSAGLLTPDPSGQVTARLDVPATLSVPVAGLAVSLEPAGGVPAPTGALYLVGKALAGP